MTGNYRLLERPIAPAMLIGQNAELVFPLLSSTGYLGPIFQGAYVFQVTLQNGIALRGSITRIPSGYMPGYTTSAYYVTQALYIGNVLCTISTYMIKMNSLTDPSKIGSLSLA